MASLYAGQAGLTCQTLFRNSRCRYFRVDTPQNQKQQDIDEPALRSDDNTPYGNPRRSQPGLEDLIDLQLAQQDEKEVVKASQSDAAINLISQDIRHQSQWVQMTEWARFLEPHKNQLSQVAALTSVPDLDESCEERISGGSNALLLILCGRL
ncbi:hypothetical protein EDB81DRAFT_767168 [Dactylonectria macrodidyma]|uniref:Uncharacterized protein n=1 Tax=Dactylonectria macrodidyma TaxID=307937 RepID=A0A9P9DE68_9HYPO|nr:hypothetical protein EDB81DRAFT_767168 [Dactylonectria macrodidyma]